VNAGMMVGTVLYGCPMAASCFCDCRYCQDGVHHFCWSHATGCHMECKELSDWSRVVIDVVRIMAGAGIPRKRILLTIAERHPVCCCTWVFDADSGKFLLKYRNTSCKAFAWHARLDGEP
jgi:hypothetical protein